MNTGYPKREIEKPKTLTERRAALKADALNMAETLDRRADAALVTLGMDSPVRKAFVNAAVMIRTLAGELRGGK